MRRPKKIGIIAITASFVAGAALVMAATHAVPSGQAASPTAIPARLESAFAGELDMNSVVAEATIGKSMFVVAPGVGANAHPDELCLGGMDMGGTQPFVGCGPASVLQSQGSALTEKDPDGTTHVYGVVPAGTTAVSVGGSQLPMSGRFFAGAVPSGTTSVTLSTPSGPRGLPIP